MPKQLSLYEKLVALTTNLWWSWQPEVSSIFRAIDPTRWSELGHNPLLLLREYPPEKLEQQAIEAVLHSPINYAYRRWQEYMASTDTWGSTHAGVLGQRPAAYFSAEFGIHESLPIYSGGLGILSGDRGVLLGTAGRRGATFVRSIQGLAGPVPSSDEVRPDEYCTVA